LCAFQRMNTVSVRWCWEC